MTLRNVDRGDANKPRAIASTRIVRQNGEYIVRAYGQDGARMPEADYFTNDRDDAQATANLMMHPNEPTMQQGASEPVPSDTPSNEGIVRHDASEAPALPRHFVDNDHDGMS